MKSSNLHIAIVMQSPDIGGAETYMSSLVDQFLRNKSRVSFATNNYRLSEMLDSRKVEKYDIPYVIDIIGNWKGLVKAILYLPFSLIFYISLLRKFKRDGVDVLLMSNFGEKMLITFLARFFHIPVVWIEYGPLKPVFVRNFGLPKLIYQFLVSDPKAIIVPSENTLQSLLTDAKAPKNKLLIIPCGTSVPKEVGHKKLKNYSNKFVIGNISRMTTEKGQQVIINAAEKIIKEIPNARFILIGNGPDKDTFLSMIHERGLTNYFDLPGFVDNLEVYFQSMDLFIFPTVWELEGFGLVSVEAMMREIPVVASRLGPVPEIVIDDRVGKLFNPNDPSDLANKIIDIFNNPKLRKRFTHNARDWAMEKYDISKIGKEILEVLQNATHSYGK